jgi:hypothetical protein
MFAPFYLTVMLTVDQVICRHEKGVNMMTNKNKLHTCFLNKIDIVYVTFLYVCMK